jgi:hypothetical protein
VLELNYLVNLEAYTIDDNYSVEQRRFEGVKYVPAVAAHKDNYEHSHGPFCLIKATFWKSGMQDKTVWVTSVVIPVNMESKYLSQNACS